MRFTASRRRLLNACQWWARPEVEAPPEEVGEPALTGTALHALISEVHYGGAASATLPDGADVETASTMFERWREWESRWDLRALPWRAEVPFAFDPVFGSARELSSKGHRDYSAATEREICGTPDVFSVVDDGAHVGDWKSTRAFYDMIDPIPQLRTLGLAIARAHDRDHVWAHAVYVSPEGVHAETYEFDAFDLDAEEAELDGLLAAIPNAQPKPGRMCRYCPARSVCPATAGVVDQAAPNTSTALAVLAKGEMATDAQLARAHEQLQIAEDIVSAARDRLKSIVAARGRVDIGDGRYLQIVTSSRTTISQKSIVESMGNRAVPMLAELRAAGAFKTSTFPKLIEAKSLARRKSPRADDGADVDAPDDLSALI